MIELTNENFTQVTQSTDLTLVDFYAPWCGPCKIVLPMLEAMAPEFPAVTFANVDVDAETGIASQHEVMSVPTVVLLRQGAEIARGSGVNGINEVVAKLRIEMGA